MHLLSDAVSATDDAACGNVHSKEPDVPQQKDKTVHTDKQQRRAGAIEKGFEQKRVAGPQAEVRAWAAVSKPNGGGKKIALSRKIPSGPVGGSGRKTNLSRSS